MTSNTQFYKEKLEEEKKALEDELNSLGRREPSNPKNWEPEPGDIDTLRSEREERALYNKTYDRNTALLNGLEIRYRNVVDALEKIDQDSYGICEECGAEIEEERLKANPAAKKCMKHHR